MLNPSPIVCPSCQSAEHRRSRRRSFADYAWSLLGILPWRCEACGTRFHARAVPLRHFVYAHCSLCGNMDLRRISFEYVPGLGSLVGRILRLPALRCEPCRHKFLSLRPLFRESEQEQAPAAR